jgi:hypothetical protein
MPSAFELLKETLVDNRSVLFTIGNKGFFRLKIYLVACFVLSEATRNRGVHLDSTENGIICFFENKKKKKAAWYTRFLLILFSIGPTRVSRVLARKKEVQAFHNQFENFIHCSYLAVRKEARGTAAIYELRNALFQFQKEKQLPILIETTVEKNKRVYERIGFRVKEIRSVSGFDTYCMVREITQN